MLTLGLGRLGAQVGSTVQKEVLEEEQGMSEHREQGCRVQSDNTGYEMRRGREPGGREGSHRPPNCLSTGRSNGSVPQTCPGIT